MDYEVSRKIWETEVAIEFTLYDNDDSESVPYYAMLPRCSYFPVYLNKIINFFSNRHGRIDPENVWLEANGVPLKLYLPIGVLYDLYAQDDDVTWNVYIRSSDPPQGYMNLSKDTMELMFMQSVKEADFLKRKAICITGMKMDEHKRLWNSVAQSHFDDFWSINRKLMDCTEKQFDRVPLRIHRKGAPFKQGSLNFCQDETIGQAISKLLSEDISGMEFVSHGIELPLDTPLLFAITNLAYPDNFLHVVLKDSGR